MTRKRNRASDVLTAQTQAREFALFYLQKTPLGLPEDMTEADFGKVMTAVTQALAAAYTAGYLAALEDNP
jgi:hypothetical protein